VPGNEINVNGESYGDYTNYRPQLMSRAESRANSRGTVVVSSMDNKRSSSNQSGEVSPRRRVYRIEIEEPTYVNRNQTYVVSNTQYTPRRVIVETPRMTTVAVAPVYRRSYVPQEPKNQLYERILKNKVIRKPNHRVEIDMPVVREKPSMNRSVVRGGAIIYK
jgi:hypothetical protein